VKLGPLNSAIRDAEKVSIYFNAGGRVPLMVPVQKTGLIDALREAFPLGRAQETGLCIRDDGCLTGDRGEAHERPGELPLELRP
jgi:hypothetical protein